MQPRARFISALERRPPAGRTPHFELVFFLTMEAFGKVHPSHRNYAQWVQMEEQERALLKFVDIRKNTSGEGRSLPRS